MKRLLQAILITLGLFCFFLACEQTKPTATEARATIDSATVSSKALRPPVLAWQHWTSGDSIELNDVLFMMQSLTKDRMVSKEALAEWFIGMAADSVLNIFVDSLPQIYSYSFPLNTRLTVKGTGASYVVKATAVSGYTTDSVGVIPTGGNFAQLQPRGDHYLASDFGTVGNGVADDYQALQKSINYAIGRNLFIPAGRYRTTQTLLVSRTQGGRIRGDGSMRYGFTSGTQIKYVGSGDALSLTGVGTESLLSRLRIEDLRITGTVSARHGINLDISGGAVLHGVIQFNTIDSFLSATSYGLNLSKCYNMAVHNNMIRFNTGGVRLYNECVQAHLLGNWISPTDSVGIQVDYPTSTIELGVVDNSISQPAGQIGIRTTAAVTINGTLFEDLDKAFEVRSGTGEFVAINLRMNSTDNPSTIADGVDAVLENCYISQDIQAGLGTTWKGIYGNASASILWPTISANGAAGISTITKVTGSPGSYTLSEIGYPGIRAGQTYTLIFDDDSVKINDEANGSVYFRTKDMQDFKALRFDQITFLAQHNDDGTVTLQEQSRHRNARFRTHTANYTIPTGGSGFVYSNQGATGDITLTLPSANGERISIVASAATHSIIVDPGGASDRFRGYGESVTFTMKTGSFMTIASQSNGGVRYWDIEDAWGNIVTSNGKGWVQGLEYAVIADSTALKFKTVRATTNYQLSNARAYQIARTNGTQVNMVSFDATDDIYIGAGTGDQDHLYLRAGSFSHATSGDNIYLQAGNATRMTVASTGEVWIGSTTDQGAYNLQVTGDQYLSGNLTMGGVNIRAGSGSPESVVTAVVGSIYLRTDGGAGTTLYVKESGTGNTGWVAK